MFRVLFSISALRFYCAPRWEFDTLTRKRRYLTTRRQVSESQKRYSAAKRGNVLHKGALGLCCGDGGRDCVEFASRRICEGSEVRLRSRFWQEITVTAQTDFWSTEIRSDPNKVAVQSAANIIYQEPSRIWVWFYWMFDMTPYTTWHQFRTLALLIRVIAERLFVVQNDDANNVIQIVARCCRFTVDSILQRSNANENKTAKQVKPFSRKASLIFMISNIIIFTY